MTDNPDQNQHGNDADAEAASSHRVPAGAGASKPKGLTDPRRYKIKAEYARGGMGRILLATDRALGREVAIKELLGTAIHEGIDASMPGTGAAGEAGRAGGDGDVAPPASLNLDAIPRTTPADAVTLERFLREARITSRLEHPNIVPVYEIAQRDNGSWYYTMKVVRGATLAARLKEISQQSGLDDAGRLSERLKLLRAFVDVCNAIAYAHSQKVVHRDLKPENIMLGGFGETVVLDWGLALLEGEDPAAISQALGTKALDKARAAHKEADTRRMTKGSSTRLTMDGAVLGTPAYMAPEQARGELSKVDFLSDVWSLGAILYEILSGKRAYENEDLIDLLEDAGKGNYQPLVDAAPEVPPELAALVASAMTPERGHRMRSARELASEVEAWIAGRALKGYRYSAREQLARLVKRHKGAFLTAAAAVVLLVGGGVWAYTNIAEKRDAAESALSERDDEAKRREAAELDAAQKQEEVYQKQLAQRQTEIADAQKAADAYPLEPAVAAVRALREEWKDRKPGDEPNPARKLANHQAVARVTSAIGQGEGLHRLLSEPVMGRRLPGASAEAAQKRADALRHAKLLMVELAAINGDYALAEMQLGWATLEGDRLSREAWAEIAATRKLIATERGAVELRRKDRIAFVLDDLAQGLSRKDRPFNAPLMEDYVFELAGFHDQQTVELLGAALKPFAVKAGWVEGMSIRPPKNDDDANPSRLGTTPTGPQIRWTQTERDSVTLCCRVLGRLGLGEQAVKALTPFAATVNDHVLAVECGTALGNTGHVSAWEPVLSIQDRFGMNSATYWALTASLRKLPPPPLGAGADANAFKDRGNARLDIGDLDGAIADFDQAINLDEKFAAAYSNRGIARGEKGNAQGAIDDYTKAIDLDEDFANAYQNRATVFLELGKLPEAIADFSAALRIEEKHVPALMGRANAYVALGRYDLAIKDCDDALLVDETFSHAWATRGYAKAEAGEVDDALPDFNKAIDLNKQGAYAAYNSRGLALQYKGLLDEALADYAQSIHINPRYWPAIFNRGLVHRERGELEDAIRELESAAEIAPEDPKVIRILADTRRRLAVKPWLTRQATTPLEHLTKAWAHARLALKSNMADEVAQADREIEKAEKALGKAPLNHNLEVAYAEACEQVGACYGTLKQYESGYLWTLRALDHRTGLANPAGCAASAASFAANWANELAAKADAESKTRAKGVTDKAFELLALAAHLGHRDAGGVEADPAYAPHRNDPRWPKLVEKFRENAITMPAGAK